MNILPTMSNQHPFIKACLDENLELIQDMINQNKDLNIDMQTGNGRTPLMIAVAKGSLKVVELLLKNYADTSIKDSNGATVFELTNNNKEMNELLHHQEYYNTLELIKQFLEHTKKEKLLDTQDKSGNTILMKAIEENNIEIVNILLQYGADPNIKNNDGDTAFTIACYFKRYKIARLLLNTEGIALDCVNEDGDTALTYLVDNILY